MSAIVQIEIPERDRHVRTYVRTHIHCENRPLIQSLTLMRSATMSHDRKEEYSNTSKFMSYKNNSISS